MKWLLLIPVLWGGSATPEMTRADYWPCSDDVVLTPPQIAEYNRSLVEEGTLDLVDILSAGQKVSRDDVLESISQYTIPRTYSYLGTGPARASLKAKILSSRNLSAIPGTVDVRYGVLVAPTDLRSFPTRLASTDDGVVSGPLCFDDFQQTRLWLGEGVLIWHESADGRWLFVRARNYAGWVEAENVAICTRAQMEDFLNCPDFAVVLEQKLVDVAGRPMRLMMGTRLPRTGSGSLLVPVRKEDGTLGVEPAVIDIDFSVGYLPYTTRNVLRQAFRLLGTPYSWGGAESFNDCSATLLSVYYCFGIELPRNSSSMIRMVRGNLGKDPDFRTLQPGSIAVFPGHAMMYIGQVDGEPFILHDVNALYDSEGVKDQRSCTVVTSTADVFRKTGISYTDSFSNFVEVK